MKNKEFKTETKKLLDLMINSIYTNKDIFLRELISNASDALDKLYYKSLIDNNLSIKHEDLEINLSIDKDKRVITISDNGIGMTKEELEQNLGTICKSGSKIFKEENDKKENIDIIGQFGVGFYSVFMVSNEVRVESKSIDSDESYTWISDGVDGYRIEDGSKTTNGTTISITLKEDSEDEDYSNYLEEYTIKRLVKKYSDYITYPIKMECSHSHLKEGSESEYETHTEIETLNSLIPIWKKNKNDVSDDEYNNFYMEKFSDYTKPDSIISLSAEGMVSYNGILFIPGATPYAYYSKEQDKGLQLYSNGVLIMDKCSDILPDYFGFVKGVIDSPDLKLNISREILQQNKVIKIIAKNVESKIKKELENLRDNDRSLYEKIYNNFGVQLKYGIYNNFGMDKEKLQDLLLFYSSQKKKMITLEEYVANKKENQDKIYYVCGDSVDKIDTLPIVEKFRDKDYELLYLTDVVDEFTMQALNKYSELEIVNIAGDNADIETKEDKEKLDKLNEEYKDMFSIMKDSLEEVSDIRFTNRLKNHPVCLTSEGAISSGMQKTLNSLSKEKISAKLILEINENHPIANKLKELSKNNSEELKKYGKILYAQARLIEGFNIENPTEISSIICDMISK